VNSGVVTNTLDCGHSVSVHTRDREHPEWKNEPVHLSRTPEARSVSEGDLLCWEGDKAFWTPKSRCFTDRQLEVVAVLSRP